MVTGVRSGLRNPRRLTVHAIAGEAPAVVFWVLRVARAVQRRRPRMVAGSVLVVAGSVAGCGQHRLNRSGNSRPAAATAAREHRETARHLPANPFMSPGRVVRRTLRTKMSQVGFRLPARPDCHGQLATS
jgi:hypothetical protein